MSFSSGILTDSREALALVRFTRPEVLWLLLAVPVLGLFDRYAAFRRRRAVGAVGRPAAIAGLQTHPARRRRLLGLAESLAWVALVLGLAGPRWGTGDESGVAVGRDVVLVIDLSKSMLADDTAGPARWQAAKAGALDLLDAVSKRGGHRVGLVVFAAKPRLVCPLTTDYRHVRAKVEELDGEYPPAECTPGPDDPPLSSGTRIGAALAAAVEAHDSRFPGYQDVILISDGDDPADDREWAKGADAARRAKIPVHVFGVGDPARPSTITVRGRLLEAPLKEGEPPSPVQTQLNEGVLKDIADTTRGTYVRAGREPPRVGEFFRTAIEPQPAREVTDDAVPQPKERYVWFLLPALALFGVVWLRGR
jgi:Ca-activated chloride channel family protein